MEQKLPTSSRISVAMCTYNGEKYLFEQLQSLANQQLLPNELIVCDDLSTDQTIDILMRFAKEAPFLVKIFVNGAQLGVTKNFEKALSLCQGDYLFPCDQDDVWQPNKLLLMREFLDKNPSVAVVFSNAELVDEHLHSLNKTIWDEVRFREKHQQAWRAGEAIDVLSEGNRVTGCTLAMRRVFLDQALPFPTHIQGFIHDAWVSFAAAIAGKIDFITTCLVLYRQHINQQIGTRPIEPPRKVKFIERFRRPRVEKLLPLQNQVKHLQQLYALALSVAPENQLNVAKLQHRLKHITMRSTLPESRVRRFMPVIVAFISGEYQQYKDTDSAWYGGIVAALGDLLE